MCREEGLAVHLKLLSHKLREPYKVAVTTAAARSQYPPNTNRVKRILSWLLQKLRTSQYSFLQHYHNSRCLAESRSLLREAPWSKHPGRDGPDCTLPWGLRPRLILLQSTVAPNSLWIMQPPTFSSRSDRSHSTL